VHKISSNKADKQLYIPVPVSLPPGSEETFQVVFTKKVACLHEKTSLFMLFCVNFGTHHEFDRWLIYNNLLFFPMMVMIDE